MNIIKFKRDTSFRNDLFTPESFAHPAKMDAQLLLWIVEKFTKVGETILDPMFGSGTTMLACILGRNVIGVELEQKFIDMAKANWEKVRQKPQLGSQMGTCQIIQGDARELENILCDKIISSPPFADSEHNYNHGLKVLGKNFKGRKAWETKGQVDKIITSPPYAGAEQFLDKEWINREQPRPHRPQVDKIITSPPYAETLMADKDKGEARIKRLRSSGHNDIADRIEIADNWHQHEGDYNPNNPEQIGNLPYGSIDSVITSPPYEEVMGDKHHSPRADKLAQEKSNPVTYTDRVDAVVTSPPYEGSLQGTVEDKISSGFNSPEALKIIQGQARGYSEEPDNIGNLKSTSYLEAMARVYSQCYAVLRPQGLMILVTKNFIREQKEVRLDLDTIKLCETAGFTFKERWYRELPAQSFWRILYHRKYPSVKVIDCEDILVFSKPSE